MRPCWYPAEDRRLTLTLFPYPNWCPPSSWTSIWTTFGPLPVPQTHVDSVPVLSTAVGGSSSPDTVWSGLTEAQVSSASVSSWRQRGLLLLLHETFQFNYLKTVWSEKPRQAYFSTREHLCRVLWTLIEMLQRKLNRTFWLQCFAERPDPPAGSVQKAQFKRANSEELCNLSSWSACCKLLLAVFIYIIVTHCSGA